MVKDATDSDWPQSASESDGTQDDTDSDAHADSVWMQLLRRIQVQTRKQTQVLVRTRLRPCHLAALASASMAVHAQQREPAQQAKQGAPQLTSLSHTCTMRCRQLAIAGCAHAVLC
jgi:hypothetical protein